MFVFGLYHLFKKGFGMKKNVVLSLLVLFLLACSDEKSAISSNSSCDLNKEDCAVLYKGEKVSFAFAIKPIPTMMPTTLKISGLKGEFKDLSVEIYGVNMNMGRIKGKLEKRGDSFFASITLSACVSQMHYKIELFEKGEPLGLSADFWL